MPNFHLDALKIPFEKKEGKRRRRRRKVVWADSSKSTVTISIFFMAR